MEIFTTLILGTLLCIVLAWMAVPTRRTVNIARVKEQGSMPLEWYLDERSHTGDLLFMGLRGVGLMVMHPTTGEPLLLEAGQGVTLTPARDRLWEHTGRLRVFCISRPLNARRVLELPLPRRPVTSPELAGSVLHELGVMAGGVHGVSPAALARKAFGSGKYRGPFALE